MLDTRNHLQEEPEPLPGFILSVWEKETKRHESGNASLFKPCDSLPAVSPSDEVNVH